MSLFSYSGRAFKFYLVNLPEDVNQQITKMILDNGGEIVDIGDPPIINFTVPENYVPGKVMYNIDFIKDCVRWGELGDLHKYKLGPKEAYDGCIMSIFMYENPSCIYRYVNNPCLRKNICPFCGSRNVAPDILDVSDSPVALQNHSGAGKLITSEISYNKGSGDATNCLKSVNEKQSSLLQDKTEVSPKLKKLRTNGNASSQEASSIYETAPDLINYSPDSNLSLTQGTPNEIEELRTDTDSITSINATQEAKETEQLDSKSQRSVKKAVDNTKHQSHPDTSENIYTSSDSEPNQSWNSEKRILVSRSRFGYKISHLPDVELIQVANISAREHESHATDESKKEAESDRLKAYKLRRQEKGKREFRVTSHSNCNGEVLISKRNFTTEKNDEENEKRKSGTRTSAEYKKDLSNRGERRTSSLINPFFVSYIEETKRSEVSSEEDDSPRSNNRKGYGRRVGKERKSEKFKKDKKKAKTSRTRKEHLESTSSSGSDTDILVIEDTNKKGKKFKKRKLYDSPKVMNPLCARKSINIHAGLNKPDDISVSEISKTPTPSNIPKGKSKLPTFNVSSADDNPNSNKDPQPNEDFSDSLTDPDGIFNNVQSNEIKRVLRPRNELPNSSYVMSDDDSDDVVEEASTSKSDKSRSKKDRSEDKDLDPTVFSSELEISDDSEAQNIKIKKENNNGFRCHVRTQLDIEHKKNGRTVQKNLKLEEWLTWAKRKTQTMTAPQKRNFAKWEKWRMLIFLIENNLIEHAKGLDAWQHMIQVMNCGQRTKMSLNNHFLKYILPYIEDFRLPKDIEKKFVILRNTKTN